MKRKSLVGTRQQKYASEYCDCNHDYDYFGNVIEYDYFLANVIEYEYDELLKIVNDYT